MKGSVQSSRSVERARQQRLSDGIGLGQQLENALKVGGGQLAVVTPLERRAVERLGKGVVLGAGVRHWGC